MLGLESCDKLRYGYGFAFARNEVCANEFACKYICVQTSPCSAQPRRDVATPQIE